MVSATEARSWTTPGAQDSAQRTYTSIKAALSQAPELQHYDYEVFLQGSYANATNIRGDSDVDIVAMLTSTFIPDVRLLSPAEKQAHETRRLPGTTTLADFRRDVHTALSRYYGAQRVAGKDKCIRVAGMNGYLDADVVPSYQVRRFLDYPRSGTPRFVEGIQIRPQSGGTIVNYPKEHKKNGQTKNDRCSDRYKPTVRQVKRLAVRAIDAGRIHRTDAPGYLLECLVYNVANDRFVPDDVDRLRDVILTLHVHDVDQLRRFSSGDGIHRLFVDDPGDHNEYTTKRVLEALWDIV